MPRWLGRSVKAAKRQSQRHEEKPGNLLGPLQGSFGPFGPEIRKKVRDQFLHRGFCTSETRIWARILLNEFWTPEFRTRILGSNFLVLFFQGKEAREKFTVEKFTSQNSPSKIQPRNRAKKFTLHLQGHLAETRFPGPLGPGVKKG